MADTQQPETDTTILTVTPLALGKIRELLDTRGTPDTMLRVFVQGSGCCGVSYGMAFEDNVHPQDTVVEQDGITLVIDPASRDYLLGAQIDYNETVMGGAFAISQPNAAGSSCGCGGGGCGCS